MIYIRHKFIMEAEHKPRFQKYFKLKCIQMAMLFHSWQEVCFLQGLSWVLQVLNCWGSHSLHGGILSVMTNAKSLVLPPPQASVLAQPASHTYNCPALLLELSHTPPQASAVLGMASTLSQGCWAHKYFPHPLVLIHIASLHLSWALISFRSLVILKKITPISIVRFHPYYSVSQLLR